MDWFEAVNNYCERTDAGYWSEPVNALTNASFVIAALLCWRMLRGSDDAGARLLTVTLFLIGVGSYLFHTHAQVWSALADVIPILVFILIYVWIATVRFFALPVWAGALAAVAYVPYAAATSAALEAVVGPLNGSVAYMPTLLLIVAYGILLVRRDRETSIGLLIGAAILGASLFFRSIDDAVCAGFPLGTHFLWHVLNGVMLGWMILVAARRGPGSASAAPDLASPSRPR